MFKKRILGAVALIAFGTACTVVMPSGKAPRKLEASPDATSSAVATRSTAVSEGSLDCTAMGDQREACEQTKRSLASLKMDDESSIEVTPKPSATATVANAGSKVKPDSLRPKPKPSKAAPKKPAREEDEDEDVGVKSPTKPVIALTPPPSVPMPAPVVMTPVETRNWPRCNDDGRWQFGSVFSFGNKMGKPMAIEGPYLVPAPQVILRTGQAGCMLGDFVVRHVKGVPQYVIPNGGVGVYVFVLPLSVDPMYGTVSVVRRRVFTGTPVRYNDDGFVMTASGPRELSMTEDSRCFGGWEYDPSKNFYSQQNFHGTESCWK